MNDPIGEPVFDVATEVDLQHGSAEPATGAADPEQPIAVLWIRDPEQRHGWREYYVKKTTPKPAVRPFGFRKAGAK